MTPPDSPRLDAEALLEHEAWVRRLARAMVGNEHEADEVVQQTWLNALLWPPRQVENLRAWLGTVARNVVRQRHRGQQREEVRRRAGAVPEATDGDLDGLERLELQSQVADAVLALRSADRDALVLRYYEELTPTQIAARTDQPLATVKSRLARARQRLRDELERRFGADDWRHSVSLLAFGRVSVSPIGGTLSAAGSSSGGAILWGGLAAAGLVGALLVLADDPPDDSIDPLRARAPAKVGSATMPLEPYAPPEPVRELAPPAEPPSERAPPPTDATHTTALDPPVAITTPTDEGGSSPEPASPWAPTDSEPGPWANGPPDGPGIHWRITFEGEPPEATPVDMTADPFCAGAHPEGFERQHVRVGEHGGLADVFIQLTDGVPDERYKAPKEAVILDQKGCTYDPQVFGIVKKQDIEIRNSDTTLHNIHATPTQNKEFNVAMPKHGMKITKTFKKGEDAILLKCDVHPWMATYCFSMEHPYFGTTDATGQARIDTTDLPDGTYGARVWHRTLGERTLKLELVDGRATPVLVIKG